MKGFYWIGNETAMKISDKISEYQSDVITIMCYYFLVLLLNLYLYVIENVIKNQVYTTE